MEYTSWNVWFQVIPKFILHTLIKASQERKTNHCTNIGISNISLGYIIMYINRI